MQVTPLSWTDVIGWTSAGGTKLGTARYVMHCLNVDPMQGTVFTSPIISSIMFCILVYTVHLRHGC